MAAHQLGARSYSPTALQDYARCPYRFFLRAIHRLSPREVPAEIDELDPLQRGSLFHAAQFQLFERLRQRGLLPVRTANLEAAWEQLDAVLAEVAARYQDELAPAIPRVWEDGVASIRSDMREWLRRASKDDAGYVPWRFELSFGLAGRPERRHEDTESVAQAVALDCGIQLRGSIDLVERDPSGTARVTDHKTGRAEGKKNELVRGAKSLQPLLYALAAEKLLADEAKVASGRLYFCTLYGAFTARELFSTRAPGSSPRKLPVKLGKRCRVHFFQQHPRKMRVSTAITASYAALMKKSGRQANRRVVSNRCWHCGICHE
jgi:ATP-dependent helicase/nuclease subunit B